MDNRSRLPLDLMVHILFCRRCRHDIALLNERFASLRGESPFEMDRDLCDAVMREVFQAPPPEYHVGALMWAGAGIVILMGMILIPFSATFSWLRQHFGAGIELPMSIVLGTAFTVYTLAAIFSNLAGIKRLVKHLPLRHVVFFKPR